MHTSSIILRPLPTLAGRRQATQLPIAAARPLHCGVPSTPLDTQRVSANKVLGYELQLIEQNIHLALFYSNDQAWVSCRANQYLAYKQLINAYLLC